ncbi:hypothetical protein B0J17DRAFT_629580 [Rhizoctonia solani]|nr:hypothetical protein B0J17DRAFT_629580 [Rhizoctonia solani]
MGLMVSSSKLNPKRKKDPSQPKQPPPAYIMYQNEVRHRMRTRFLGLPPKELVKEISVTWKELSKWGVPVYGSISVYYDAYVPTPDRSYMLAQDPTVETLSPRYAAQRTATLTDPLGVEITTSPLLISSLVQLSQGKAYHQEPRSGYKDTSGRASSRQHSSSSPSSESSAHSLDASTPLLIVRCDPPYFYIHLMAAAHHSYIDGLLAQFGRELCGCPRETSLIRSTWGYGLSLRPGQSTRLRLVPHYGLWVTPYGLCEALG